MNNVYESPAADVEQPLEKFEYMGFWMRVVASILDNIWLGVLIVVLSLVMVSAFSLDEESLEYYMAGGSLNIVLPALLVIGLWVKFGSTPGKMLFKAKIVDAETHEPVSSGRLVLRYLGYIVSILPLMLGILWVGWDKRKQGFHDKIAGTVVIIEK
jgi:uncharacterized RDD family membrane protein YckC